MATGPRSPPLSIGDLRWWCQTSSKHENLVLLWFFVYECVWFEVLNKLDASLINKYPIVSRCPILNSLGSKKTTNWQRGRAFQCIPGITLKLEGVCSSQSIRLPQIVKRSISNKSFLGALCISSVSSWLRLFSSDSSGVVRNWSDSLVGSWGAGLSILWVGWVVTDEDTPSSTGSPSEGVRTISQRQ